MNSSITLALPNFLDFCNFSGAKNLISKLSETEIKLEKTCENEYYHYDIMPSERISFLALKYGTASYAKNDYQFIK